MKISLLTDAPKHNLALMKIATHHKNDEIQLNLPLWKTDIVYASFIFEKSHQELPHGTLATFHGGIAVDPQFSLPEIIEKCKPDYSLFNLNHSLGYTFRDCYRKCPFCKVPLLPKDKTHRSIHEFHEPRFKTIELLNNNTFFDPLWEETFKEIYGAKLSVIDNGNDLRLLDDKKAWWVKKLRWRNQPKFAWDLMKDEKKIIAGLKLLKKYKIRGMIYVLMGYNTTDEENLYRCEVINSFGCDPFPMLYKSTPLLRHFKRFLCLRYYRQHRTIEEAWKIYSRSKRQ